MSIDFQPIEGTSDLDAPILFEAVYESEEMEPLSFSTGSTLTVRGWSTEQLISFGNFLLSKDREDLLKAAADHNPETLPVEERSKEVSHADLSNWKFRIGLFEPSSENDAKL